MDHTKPEAAACPVKRWDLLKARLRNLPPEAFVAEWRQTPGAILLDVRTESEYIAGHIEGAVHADYLAYDFLDRLDNFDKHLPYFVYCRSGRRSVRACTLMRNGGFTRVIHLEGGYKNFASE